MIDAREAVAKETAERWLGRTFAPPMSLRSEVMADAQAERANDIKQAIFDSLPRKERLELLERCEDARKHLSRQSKTMTWPTPKEIVDAFREAAPKADAGDDDWPHVNSEYVVESTARWIRKFNDWPGYLENHVEVARELVERGEFTREQIIEAGFPTRLLKLKPGLNAEAAAEAFERIVAARRMEGMR